MQFVSALVSGAHAHWATLMAAMGAWIAVATFLARKWQKPPISASSWLRAAHFLLVDLPALAATLNGKTWMGFTFSIPFVTWTVRGSDEELAARTKQAGFVRIELLLFVAAIGCAIAALGCATSATKPGATLADKIKDDQAAIQLICSDVQTQCLPKFANPLPAIKDLAAALADFAGATADPTLAVGGVLQVIDAYPAIASDAAASMCVIRTVVADIKKLQPAKAAALDRLVARLEAELSARQSLSLVEVPVACQQRPDDDHGACRKVVLDCGDNSRDCFQVAVR